jgi:hypothetical protein
MPRASVASQALNPDELMEFFSAQQDLLFPVLNRSMANQSHHQPLWETPCWQTPWHSARQETHLLSRTSAALPPLPQPIHCGKRSQKSLAMSIRTVSGPARHWQRGATTIATRNFPFFHLPPLPPSVHTQQPQQIHVRMCIIFRFSDANHGRVHQKI